ncbi:MAG: GTPase Era [Negativicutes bacterium]|jgi:GTP-binding protein Era
MSTDFKSGFVAVIGRPNAGKSTLINSIVKQKISIVSDKPQTTRTRVMGIHTTENVQIVFLDTPGIHKPKTKLGEKMMNAATGSLSEVDAICYIIDASEKPGPGEQYIIEMLKKAKAPVILLINKIDRTDEATIFALPAKLNFDFAHVLPISALKGNNLDKLESLLSEMLPIGPKYFPDDMVTDQPERLIVAEIIREKILNNTTDEIPHSIAVDIDEIKYRDNGMMYCRATIYVERDSQKGIIVGSNGSMLKLVGQQARIEAEALLGCKIYLDLWVKVKRDWRDVDGSLKTLGF